MSFIGGGVGVVLAVLLFRFFFKLSWKEFLLLFDMVLVIVPLGIFFGRLGNYLNQELYGIAVAQLSFSDGIVSFLQSINLVHVYSHVDEVLRINTNFLSMLFEGICLLVVNGALFCFMLRKKSFKV
jgi:phosphatidylglycerol:prolipoprotein diacylglycerol transferase